MIKTEQEQFSNDSDEISLKEAIFKVKGYLQYFLSKWVIIVTAGIIGSALGFTYAYSKKLAYTAELSFALQDEKSGGSLSGALGLAGQLGIDLGSGAGGEFAGDNILALMKSRSMIEKALLTPISINGKRETLAEYYISFNKLRETWKDNKDSLKLVNIHFLPNADRSKFTLKQDSILGAFHKTIVNSSLAVDKIDKKLSIISIKVVSSNEVFAKYFTEFLATAVSDFYVQTKTEKSIKNVAILQRQTDSVRHALNTAISGVAVSVDVNPNPNPSRQTLRVPSQRRQVDVQANTIILGELVRNLEIAKMSLLQETPLIQVIDKPILPLEKTKLSKLISMIVGGIICGVLSILILWFRKLLVDINF